MKQPTWDTERKLPYTQTGVRRLKCMRCGAKAAFQWEICSDGNNHRTICRACDVELNRLVLEFMKHPKADELIKVYSERVLK